MTKNKESTRYYSQKQEDQVAAIINGKRTANSGAGNWQKSDVFNKKASLSCECKTSMTPKQSFSIKKEWLEKHKLESFANRLRFPVIAFNFGPDEENYFVINEKTMRILVEYLESINEE